MKKKKLCCKKLEDKIKLEKSNFSLLKHGTVLLNCGFHRVTIKAIERLAKAVGIPLHTNIKLQLGPPNKLVKIPFVIPIAFCPFCGKKIISPLGNTDDF